MLANECALRSHNSRCQRERKENNYPEKEEKEVLSLLILCWSSRLDYQIKCRLYSFNRDNPYG